MRTEIERHVSPDLFPPPGYSHAVVSPPGSTVWTAGGVPLDASGELVGPGDLTAQTEQVLVNLTVALGLAGATPADVVRTTVYVVTSARSDLGVVWDAVQASPYAPAASTLLGVGLLGYEGQLVEIEATAVAGGPISPDSRAGHHGAGPAPLPSSRRPPTPR